MPPLAADFVQDGQATDEIVILKDANPIIKTTLTKFQDRNQAWVPSAFAGGQRSLKRASK